MSVSMDTAKPGIHYKHVDVTVPPGKTLEDLDWTAFTWELVKKARPYDDISGNLEFAQIVLVPGAVIYRSVWDDHAISNDSHAEQTITFESEARMNIVGYAQELTQSCIREGFTWSRHPYPCDFTRNNLHLCYMDRPGEVTGAVDIHTLGDVIVHAMPETKRSFFGHINFCRPTH